MEEPERMHALVPRERCLIDERFMTSITLVGAGGTGSHMAEGLARMHFALRQLGHQGLSVTVFDDDAYEPHNAGRQIMRWQDVGVNKAHATVERVNRMYGTAWIASPSRFVPNHNMLMGNIIITAVDGGRTRNELQRQFRQKHAFEESRYQSAHQDFSKTYYWLDLGNDERYGQVILGSSKTATCVEFNGLYPEDEPKGSCSMRDSLLKQDLFINQSVATAGLALLWDLFRRPRVERSMIFVNLKSHAMRSGFKPAPDVRPEKKRKPRKQRVRSATRQR